MNNDLIRLLPKRYADAHKGSFGRLLFLGGSSRMTGCAVLAALGALRSGVGILECACEQSVLNILQNRIYEAVYTLLPDLSTAFSDLCDQLLPRLSSASTLAIGPGLAGGNPRSLRGEALRDLIVLLSVRAPCPTVLDADALTVFEGNTTALKHFSRGLVITPHPGELSVLTGRSVPDIQSDRREIALSFAREHQCTVLLKGNHTVIASPDGELTVNTTGNPYMARGGSGDVLTGIIGSLLAQGLSPYDAARLGAYLHGGAADLAARELGLSMLPSEIPLYIGKFILEHRV